MRGKEVDFLGLLCRSGITPAYAGKSVSPGPAPLRRLDHPRVCGEKGVKECLRSRRFGSPPRMRGKEFYSKEVPAADRITPAYAGKRL